MIAAVSHCTIPAGKIRIRHDRVTQDDVVLVSPLSEPLSGEAMHCILEATTPSGYVVRFEDQRQNTAFWQLVFREGEERARAEGRAWLSQHGLLDGLPRFSPGGDMTTYLRAVETHCRVEPGSALEAVDRDVVTYRTDFMSRQLAVPANSDAFICLNNVLASSDLAFGGVRVGFVAHAALSERNHH
jgi:hypothetical protein